MPPGKNVDDWWTIMRSGMWRLYFQLSPEGRKRYYDELLPLLHHTKAEILGERDDNAYYLVYLGTKPHARGRGYAGKLLRAMIERASPDSHPHRILPCRAQARAPKLTSPRLQADAENRPVYLESSSLANNAYYAKWGFVVKKEIFLKRGPVPVQLSIMVREARPVPRLANLSAVATLKSRTTAVVKMA